MIKKSHHDNFFKGALGDPKVLSKALQGLLPKDLVARIDFESLEFLPQESVGESLGSLRTEGL